MSNLDNLIAVADSLDKGGRKDLANRIDRIVKLAAEVNIDTTDNPKPFQRDEAQRLICVQFEHLCDLYYDIVPYIEYLEPFWEIIKSALDQTRLKIDGLMKEKTDAFDFTRLKPYLKKLNDLRDRLREWRQKDLGRERALTERYLLMEPLKTLVTQLRHLFADDETLKQVEMELVRIINVFDNVFDQTVGEIADVQLKRSL